MLADSDVLLKDPSSSSSLLACLAFTPAVYISIV